MNGHRPRKEVGWRTFVASSLSMRNTSSVKYFVCRLIPYLSRSLVIVPAEAVSCSVMAMSLGEHKTSQTSQGELSVQPNEQVEAHTSPPRRRSKHDSLQDLVTHSICLTVSGSCRSLFGNFSRSGTILFRSDHAGELDSRRMAASSEHELTTRATLGPTSDKLDDGRRSILTATADRRERDRRPSRSGVS